MRDMNPKWATGNRYGVLTAIANYLVEMTNPKPEWEMLDVACGAGTCAQAFSPLVANVAAVDVDPKMIVLCGNAMEKESIKNVTPKEEDVCCLSFVDETFDIITGDGAISNLDNPLPALKQIHRVLKEDGFLALGDFLLPPQLHELWKCLSVFRYNDPRPYLHYHQVMDLLNDSGFEIIKYRPFRWTYPVGLENKDFPDKVKELYKKAFQAANAQTKEAVKLHQVNGRCVITCDCFALVAVKIKDNPRWECIEPELFNSGGKKHD